MKSKERDRTKSKTKEEEHLSSPEMPSPSMDGVLQQEAVEPVVVNGRGKQNDNDHSSSNEISSKRVKLFWTFGNALVRPVKGIVETIWFPISHVTNVVLNFLLDLFFGRMRLRLEAKQFRIRIR